MNFFYTTLTCYIMSQSAAAMQQCFTRDLEISFKQGRKKKHKFFVISYKEEPKSYIYPSYLHQRTLQSGEVGGVGRVFLVLPYSTEPLSLLSSSLMLEMSLHSVSNIVRIISKMVSHKPVWVFKFLYRRQKITMKKEKTIGRDYRVWMGQCKAALAGHAHPSNLVPHM